MNLPSCWIREALSDDYLMKTCQSPPKGAMTNENLDWLIAHVRRVRSLPLCTALVRKESSVLLKSWLPANAVAKSHQSGEYEIHPTKV